jgi:hypothetical protein
MAVWPVRLPIVQIDVPHRDQILADDLTGVSAALLDFDKRSHPRPVRPDIMAGHGRTLASS